MTMPGRKFSSSSSSYRYGFNGKEKNSELNESDYDLGERMYDARLGRMKSIDRFFKKYPYFSPYQYAGNSPIKIMDNNGDSLRLAGGATEITKFKAILDNAFATKITVQVDANGFATLSGDASKLTGKDKALYNALNAVITDKKTTDIALLSSTQRQYAIGGAFQGATVKGKKVNSVDLYDVEKFPSTGFTPQGDLIHEIWETYQDQVKGKHAFGDAHKEALKIQGQVDDVTVGDNYGDFDNAGTGKGYTLITTKKGEYFTVVADVKNMDITGATVQKGWIVPDGKGKGGTKTITPAAAPKKTKKP
jgi:RHS repeat-associated protein